MSVHLYLAPMPLPIGFGPPMLLATTPESAIALLETGRVSRLSVAKEWEEDCDPTNRVRRFYERELLAGKQMPEWLIEDFQTLVKTRSAKTKTTKMVMVE